jgi:hypothetical protein
MRSRACARIQLEHRICSNSRSACSRRPYFWRLARRSRSVASRARSAWPSAKLVSVSESLGGARTSSHGRPDTAPRAMANCYR